MSVTPDEQSELEKKKTLIIPPLKEVEGGYTGFTLSVCPSVDRIGSALYLPQ